MSRHRCELTVRGDLADAVLELIRSRFEVLATRTGSGPTTSLAVVADQAAQRALLTLLWDTGHELIELRVDPG